MLTFQISAVSVFNSVQTYVNTDLTKRVYEANPNAVTPLSARTFGTWTLLAAIVRIYASYYISNPQLYDVCLYSYVLALLHFGSEWLLFKTAKFGKGLLGPLIVATTSITWMVSKRNEYVPSSPNVSGFKASAETLVLLLALILMVVFAAEAANPDRLVGFAVSTLSVGPKLALDVGADVLNGDDSNEVLNSPAAGSVVDLA
ncbi:hypothetical protein OGAPHI_003936 [Ogataea philodendri]|uniref:Ergosterol biosynthetic protein 28 n=1 Tax=Ogataea philodendri TaxID=1378263 RepID=A0A9P8T4A9_9ASCO|nr:uncharacterized protein OGAPHI_003936 [Ogataea philodendri]KAH3665748.1 hypothetical protein OGAPHI_003936 [Ogataea philodendri]